MHYVIQRVNNWLFVFCPRVTWHVTLNSWRRLVERARCFNWRWFIIVDQTNSWWHSGVLARVFYKPPIRYESESAWSFFFPHAAGLLLAEIAFRALREREATDGTGVVNYCRDNAKNFKVPRDTERFAEISRSKICFISRQVAASMSLLNCLFWFCLWHFAISDQLKNCFVYF